jgi:hypothetical protein
VSVDNWLADTRTSYDAVAVSYAETMVDSIEGAPEVSRRWLGSPIWSATPAAGRCSTSDAAPAT